MPIQMSRDEIRAVYRQGEDAVVNLIEMLIARLDALEAEVERLKGRVSKDSHNSSKPPSTDMSRKPKSLRQKSNRRTGGQSGHPGHTLERSEKIDHAVDHPATGICECGADISEGKLVGIVSRQVHDLPENVELEVTEHRAEKRTCTCGKTHCAVFPEGVEAPVQYGERIRARMVYLSAYQLLPQKRTTEAMLDLFGVSVSQGTLNNVLCQAHEKLEVTEQAIKSAIRDAPVMHVDETGMYVNGKRLWEHTCGTPKFTFYFCHERRGTEAIDAGEMLRDYVGRIVHDGWKPYMDLDCLHALCNAHHLRELVFVHEKLKQKWAGTLIELLCRIKKTVDRAKAADRDQLAAATLDRYHKRYSYIIAAGYRANPAIEVRKPGQRGRIKQSPARNLLDRLSTYSDEVLAFMHDFRVPFDNNISERDLRMTKVKQKVSGCFRSKQGADAFCRIRGYISTVKKHGLHVLAHITKCFSSDGRTSLIPIST